MRKSKIKAGDDLTDGLDVAIFELKFLLFNMVDGKNTLQEGGRWCYRWEKKADVTGGTCV